MWYRLSILLKSKIVLVTLVGYSFHLLTITLTSWIGSIDYFVDRNIAASTSFQALNSTSFVLVFLIAALVAYRLKTPLSDGMQNVFLVTPSLMLLLGILLLVLESFYFSVFTVLCSAVLLGAGGAGNFMVYQRTFYSFVNKNASVVAIVVGGTALAALEYYLVSWLPSFAVLVLLIVIVIPATCAAPLICKHFWEWNPPDPPVKENSEKGRLKGAFSSLLMPCISIAFIAFLWQIFRVLSVNHGDIVLINNLGAFGRLFSAVVLISILAFNHYQIRMDVFYRWALPVVATVILLLPFFGWWYDQLLTALIYCLFSIASMIAILAFNQVSYFYRVSPLVIFGFGYGSFHLIGDIGMSIVSSSLGDVAVLETFQAELVFALIALYVIFILFVLSNKIEQKLKISAWNSKKLNMIDKVVSARKAACLTLSRQHDLTAKECETLEYISLGYQTSTIASLMVISENTVRFHQKNIYKKLSVHNKHDLFMLLDESNSQADL